jgi:hypothetical protein
MSHRASPHRSVWRPLWTLLLGVGLVVPNCGLREGIVSHCAGTQTCCCGTGGACCRNGQCPNRSAPSTTSVTKLQTDVPGDVRHAPPGPLALTHLLAAEQPSAALSAPGSLSRPTLRTLNVRINT